MATQLKRCKQCGVLKESEYFRLYTYSRINNTAGRVSICRECESLNSKYKKLLEKLSTGVVSPTDRELLSRIQNLYTLLECKGYHTPLSRKQPQRDALFDRLDTLIKCHSIESPITSTSPTSATVEELPAELEEWLNCPFETWIESNILPEYLQETIYESLKAKYRPQIGVDKNTYLPIYDDTYRTVLNQILKRFDDYEEMYSAESSDQSEE